MSDNFFPEDYEVPSSGGQYMKFEKGENKFRILSRPILGYVWWVDKRPVRIRKNDEGRPEDARHFWSCVVWNYKHNAIQILEITQSTVQKPIKALADDKENWGSPLNYDLKVTKEGDGKDTEYTVTPVPPKPVAKEISEAYADMNINLEALFENGDPFKVTTNNSKVVEETLEDDVIAVVKSSLDDATSVVEAQEVKKRYKNVIDINPELTKLYKEKLLKLASEE